MQTHPNNPHDQWSAMRRRFYRHGSIMVEEYSVDWDDPGQSTEERILALIEANEDRCLYLNPQFTVTCQQPVAEFFGRARKCQAAWFRRFGKVLGSAGLRRASKRFSFKDRQFTFTGMMVVHGRLLAPHEWPRSDPPAGR